MWDPVLRTRSSAVAEKPRDARCYIEMLRVKEKNWKFTKLTQLALYENRTCKNCLLLGLYFIIITSKQYKNIHKHMKQLIKYSNKI